MAKKQTAGRDLPGKLAPKFAALNDDVLFGEVWSREAELSARDRSIDINFFNIVIDISGKICYPIRKLA